MTETSSTIVHATSRSGATGSLFGVPLGDLGWFGSLLIAVASGFLTFFAATFCAIIFILIDHAAAHGTLDFASSYRRIGLPAGLLVMVLALLYLGRLWLRRILRRS